MNDEPSLLDRVFSIVERRRDATTDQVYREVRPFYTSESPTWLRNTIGKYRTLARKAVREGQSQPKPDSGW